MEYHDLPVGELRVPAYQRPEHAQHIRRLVTTYDPRLLGTLVASYRDGCYWLIDGVQRRAATEIKYGASHKVLCEVHFGLSEADEVEMFDRLNRHRLRVSALERFRAQLTIESPEEMEIAAIVENAGLKIGNRTDKTSLRSVTVLMDAYHTIGPGGLERILNIAVGAYSHEGAIHGRLLDGIRVVLQKYGARISDQRLIRRLAETGGVYSLLGMARGGGSGHGSLNVANAIITVYNYNLREENRMPLLYRRDGG